MKVYIILADNGYYYPEDYDKWNVEVCKTKELAEKRVEELRQDKDFIKECALSVTEEKTVGIWWEEVDFINN